MKQPPARRLKWLLRNALLAGLCLGGTAQAEQSRDYGEYRIHYSAQGTLELSPEIARRYGIRRDAGRALLVVTVQKRAADGPPQPVAASVSGRVRSLLGESQNLATRELREGTGLSYLAEFDVSHLDTLSIELQIRPQDSGQDLALRFVQQFFAK